MEARVSEKGQVTIPKRLRDRLGIKAGEVLDFEEDEGTLVARKASSRDAVSDLFGTLSLGLSVDDFVASIRGPGPRS